ncbi:hypothetical protein RhiJN_02463 [Ceratobasidium sp. AG-Ba]|nr:hypothetical protein RhiJN_02463 [Ceratobasidium sp. AG-Ba]QRW03394.1 hypothetical protein RhiLY_02393 [Ceratobasidium sp. AG-Ba]
MDFDTLNIWEIQRLLSRCAVATLTVRGVRPIDVFDLSGTVPNLKLASVPNLRVLILCVHYGHEKQIIPGLLNYLTKHDTAGRLLRHDVLMLNSGRINLAVEEILEQILEKLELRNLVLFNTRFGESAFRLDSDGEEDDAGEILEKLRRLVVSRDGKMTELDKYPVQIDYEVDRFVQDLASCNCH